MSRSSEFEEIGRMNNDAYKRRASADLERIIREKGGGKIGPENVTAYTQDMADFSAKKQGDIADMFKNPPIQRSDGSRQGDPEDGAGSEVHLTNRGPGRLSAQAGRPPPRNRGVTIAKQGSIRDPGNVNAIKEAHGAASTSQASAVDDLVDTLDEIKKTKPDSPFAKSAADDIATIIGQAPAEHRAASIAKLSRADPELAQAVKASPNFSAVDDIVRTGEVKAVTGAGEEAAGLSRAAAEAGEEAATVGRMRKGLTAATETLEKAGEVAVRVDAAVAIAKIGEWSATVNKALDPNITDEEAAGLFEKAAGLSEQIAESGLIVPLMEHHPVIATVYLTWTVACVAGEWVVKNRETGEFAGRQRAPVSTDR